MALAPLSVRAKTKASVPPVDARGDAGLAARGQIGVGGGAGDIDLAAGNREPADPAAGGQRAQILGPGRGRSDVATGIFADDGFAILDAGDIQAAVGAGGGGAHLIVAAGAELVLRQQIALGIEFGEIGVGAALRGLAGADQPAGDGGLPIDGVGQRIARYRSADIDIAAGIDAHRIGLIVGQGLDLLDPSLVALRVIAGDEGILIAVGDRNGGEIGGRGAGDHHAAGGIERQPERIGAAGAAQQFLPYHIAGGIIFGEIGVLGALIELAAEIAGGSADHKDVAACVDHGVGGGGGAGGGALVGGKDAGRRAGKARQLGQTAALVGGGGGGGGGAGFSWCGGIGLGGETGIAHHVKGGRGRGGK